VESGLEPIGDEEFLYRRIPASMDWYDPATQTVQPEAFGPNKNRDFTGISVSRSKYASVQDAARSQPGKRYYVAVLSAKDIRRAGMSIEPRPQLPDKFDPSHAELPDLNAGNYKDSVTLERQRTLARLVLSVEGPIETPLT
jgi:hypothetical protein